MFIKKDQLLWVIKTGGYCRKEFCHNMYKCKVCTLLREIDYSKDIHLSIEERQHKYKVLRAKETYLGWHYPIEELFEAVL